VICTSCQGKNSGFLCLLPLAPEFSLFAQHKFCDISVVNKKRKRQKGAKEKIEEEEKMPHQK
jgi:hypothetical protein